MLIWEQTEFISLYYSNWLVYITEISPSEDQYTLYVPTEYRSILLRSVYLVFLCFVWMGEQREINMLYNINWLVYIIVISPSEAQRTLKLLPDYRSSLLHSVHLVYSAVLCESENKEKIFLCTTLTDLFI